MAYFLNIAKGAAQQELDHFFKGIHATQFITQSAFTQARAKLSPTAFCELNTRLTDIFFEQATIRTWRGFRLCAVDGSRLIRVNLKSGTEVLVTNLLDEQDSPAQIFKPLYHLRWGVEENYKRQK